LLFFIGKLWHIYQSDLAGTSAASNWSWVNYCLFLWNRVLNYLEVLPLLHRSPFLKSLIFQTWNLWTRRGFNHWHLWKNNGSITALCSSTYQKRGCLPPFLLYWSANVLCKRNNVIEKKEENVARLLMSI
jgi:hypothetical protein